MTDRNEDTCSLTLRSVSRQTIDTLYELKTLRGKPICRLIDEIVTNYYEKDPSLLAMRQDEGRRLAEEFGGADLEHSLRALLSIGKVYAADAS
ncbi:MAG: hypothetical protein WCG92_18250 [Hyphomicrobiales bacterium]